MCAAQLDELPATNDTPDKKSEGGGLMAVLIAVILGSFIGVVVIGALFWFVILPDLASANGQSSSSGDSEPINMESSGGLQYFELTGLITNLGGPIKSRYINVELKLEGLAGDFEKVLELNEHRIRDKALQIMGGYSYEDAQLDGFQERVRVDLKKGFSIILKDYRSGESDIIRHIYFTQFVVQ